jgi:hypothetical protein
MFQAIAAECCAQAQPTPAALPSPRKSPQPWSWRGRQGTAEHISGPPTPVTPHREPAARTSFPTAPRYSSDSSGNVGESGRRPGITQSREWAGPAAGAGATAAMGAAGAWQQEPEPLFGKGGGGGGNWRTRQVQPREQQREQEYIMDESAFSQGPLRYAYAGDYGEGSPPGLPDMDYNAKGTCKIT